ncbi:uncharacterized protein LOC133884958 [Phragmites australis]|uniref:uncharacterized protein LOC133884958 n=1 Tax=Phragmites australis TaxID=29695 RepID=UPI002D7930F6|nr:uncharacterized protein LOC133884958 [Phragmites australis]
MDRKVQRAYPALSATPLVKSKAPSPPIRAIPKSGHSPSPAIRSQHNTGAQIPSTSVPSSLSKSGHSPPHGLGAYTTTSVVVAGVIGYAYIKWKGWKLSDMMFVTKHGLSDACNVVGSQLDQVSDSVIVTRKHLAGRIDRVDISLDETQQIIEGTRDEVAVIHGDLSAFQEDLQSVNFVVQGLESKLRRLECAQDQTVDGTHHLCEFSRKMGGGHNTYVLQVPSSIPAERILRATCLPRPAPRLALEPVSPVPEWPRAETSQVSPAAESPRAEASQEQQGVVSRTSSTREGSSEASHVASSSTEASMSTRNPSSSRFGFLRASAC